MGYEGYFIISLILVFCGVLYYLIVYVRKHDGELKMNSAEMDYFRSEAEYIINQYTEIGNVAKSFGRQAKQIQDKAETAQAIMGKGLVKVMEQMDTLTSRFIEEQEKINSNLSNLQKFTNEEITKLNSAVNSLTIDNMAIKKPYEKLSKTYDTLIKVYNTEIDKYKDADLFYTFLHAKFILMTKLATFIINTANKLILGENLEEKSLLGMFTKFRLDVELGCKLSDDFKQVNRQYNNDIYIDGQIGSLDILRDKKSNDKVNRILILADDLLMKSLKASVRAFMEVYSPR